MAKQQTMDVILLTKSSKFDKYCVAGIDAGTGAWVRFVTEDEGSHDAVGDKDMALKGGGTAAVLDKVQVPVVGPHPGAHQPENVLLDAGKPWTKLGTATLKQVCQLHPPETPRYIMNGKYATIKEEYLPGYSLSMVQVTDLDIYHNDKRKMKCSFTYNNWKYEDISMTDPAYYFDEDRKSIGKAILIVSLPDAAYKDNFYKFVAKVFPL